jgi:predicted DNA-binding protein YlxM (UPF0122 family)
MQIYLTTNKINGKKYIGRELYNNPNYLGSGKNFIKAVKKYGKENFVKEIIEKCYNEKHLNERERYWISYYNASNSKQFYNITEGGEGGDTKNFKFSKKQKENICKLYTTKKYNLKRLKSIYGCGVKTLKNILFENNINVIGSWHKSDILEKYKQTIINLYVNNNYDTVKIAAMYNSTSGAIRNLLIRNNIKLNSWKSKIENLKKEKNKIIDLYKQGYTVKKIGTYYNCSGPTIGKFLVSCGVQVLTMKVKRDILLKEKKNIVELYINEGLSVKQIAKKYNRSYDAIKDTLLKNNVCIGNKKVNRRIIE